MLKRRTVFPPVEPKPEEIVITRQPFRRHLFLRFVWNETYRLSASDTCAYLQMLGQSSPGWVVDLVWNFFSIHYCVDTQVVKIIPQSSVEEVFGERSLTGRVVSAPV